jgi:hypothetical protein
MVMHDEVASMIGPDPKAVLYCNNLARTIWHSGSGFDSGIVSYACLIGPIYTA